MIWVMMAALVAAIVLVGVGFAAFWPEWPPIEPGVHRASPDPANPPDPAPVQEHPLPMSPDPSEDMIWSTEASKRDRARHRYEDLGQGTIRLPWYEVPVTGELPIYPEQ